MSPTICAYDEKLIHPKLQQLSLVTGSDLSAIGIIDQTTRKFSWVTIVGSISSRTSKIRQNMQLGLIGEVLRTGCFLQMSQANTGARLADEAIMLTEKLCHAAAWPIVTKDSCMIILIGKRMQGRYEYEQITVGARLVEELIAECSFNNNHIPKKA